MTNSTYSAEQLAPMLERYLEETPRGGAAVNYWPLQPLHQRTQGLLSGIALLDSSFSPSDPEASPVQGQNTRSTTPSPQASD
ncbi:hypothetical protein MKZ38_009186 [Zalerion maritima]|uniref:Uncharacterized protein n=1 Tax=Zalerion maritima TaxID=339359 RepID=A0AAD5WVV0_9PEZI|nr:hypothetical protein MKZ38_009186 [Zalerion maritima]